MRAFDKPPVIALTAGEPAGIGPELVAAVARESWPARLVIVADRGLIESRAALSGKPLSLPDFADDRAGSAPCSLMHVPLATPSVPGELELANGRYVLAMIEAAAEGCLSGRFDAMVTAPVHKGVINDAGIPFTGHTEFLAAKTNTPHVVMLLVGGGMRVALATIHLPLQAVPAAITRDSLMRTLRILHGDLVRRPDFFRSLRVVHRD